MGIAQTKRLRLPETLRGKRVIWSREHGAYWRANRAGYCTELLGAGLYSPEEAEEICKRAAERAEMHFDAEEKWRRYIDSLSPQCFLALVLNGTSQDRGAQDDG